MKLKSHKFKLIAHLHPTLLEQVHWLMLDEHDQIIEGPQCTPLADLTNYRDSCSLTVLISSLALKITELQLPTSTYQQLQQAIPFALEDHLAAENETLHYAFNRYKQQQSVAIIDHTLMQNLLEALTNLKLYPSAIIPDIYALPITAAQWTIVIAEQIAYVRLSAYSGFAIEESLLPQLLTLKLAATSLDSMPSHIKIINVGTAAFDDVALADKVSRGVPQSVLTFSLENSPTPNLIQYLASHLSTSTFTVNLLQGKFKHTLQKPMIKRLAWYTTGLAVIFSSLFVSTQWLQYAYYQKKQTHLNNEITRLYKQFFPNITLTDNPRQRIEQWIKQTQQQKTTTQGLQLLAKLAPILGKAQQAHPALRLTHLQLESNKLSLQITVPQLELVTQLNEQLKPTGIPIIQKNMQQHDDHTITVHYEVTL